LRYFRRRGYEFKDSNDQIVAGGDLYLAEAPGTGRDTLESIAQSVLLSKFLPAFCIFFGPGTDEETGTRALDVLRQMRAAQIGVFRVRQDKTVDTHQRVGRIPQPYTIAEYQALVSAFAGRR